MYTHIPVRQVLANDNYNGQAGTMMALGTLNPPPAAMSSVIQQPQHTVGDFPLFCFNVIR